MRRLPHRSADLGPHHVAVNLTDHPGPHLLADNLGSHHLGPDDFIAEHLDPDHVTNHFPTDHHAAVPCTGR